MTEQGGREGRLLGRRRREPCPELDPRRSLRKRVTPPGPPAPQRPSRHPRQGAYAPERSEELGRDAGQQHHDLQIDPPPEKPQRWGRRPSPTPLPSAAERVPKRVRLARGRDLASPRLPRVVGAIERPATVLAACRSHPSRDLGVERPERRKELLFQTQIVHHRSPPRFCNPGGRPPRRLLASFLRGLRLPSLTKLDQDRPAVPRLA